jgi:hypothetical protein
MRKLHHSPFPSLQPSTFDLPPTAPANFSEMELSPFSVLSPSGPDIIHILADFCLKSISFIVFMFLTPALTSLFN